MSRHVSSDQHNPMSHNVLLMMGTTCYMLYATEHSTRYAVHILDSFHHVLTCWAYQFLCRCILLIDTMCMMHSCLDWLLPTAFANLCPVYRLRVAALEPVSLRVWIQRRVLNHHLRPSFQVSGWNSNLCPSTFEAWKQYWSPQAACHVILILYNSLPLLRIYTQVW